jgi:hypothetical protein
MNKSLLLCLGWAAIQSLQAGGSIRKVDFANSVYPWRESASWPDDLEWQGTAETNVIQLLNGRWERPDEDSDQRRLSGLVLDEVVYSDLQGDSREEAVVVLRFDSGGTMYYYWVYVYSADATKPRLLAYFRAGDRSARGLYRVYVRNRKLIMELYDPDKREGDCCSSGFTRESYRWNGQVFAKTGTTGHGSPKFSSRRPVSTFGLPADPTHQPD